MTPTNGSPATASVTEICSRLIQFDTSNYGSNGSNGERDLATYLVQTLQAAGYQPTLLESQPTRANVLLRVPGRDPQLPGLLVHGHLDVVPVEEDQWTTEPFAGTVQNGYIYGRGATDMKGAVASMLTTLLTWSTTGRRPRRDIVFAFVADEEEDGDYGAKWLVDNHPQWLTGIQAAIGESGGAAIEHTDFHGHEYTIYPIATAERGTLHMTIRASGTSGHGSRGGPDTAIIRLIEAISRIAHHQWPANLPAATQQFLLRTTSVLGIPCDLATDAGVDAALDHLGDPLAGFARATVRCSANPTVLRAGYKVNVVPGAAEADLDVRTIPGSEQEMLSDIDQMLGPHLERTFLRHHPGITAPIQSPWYDAIAKTITTHDPTAIVIPFCMGGGTDAKSFSRLGIQCYGFTPLTPDPAGRLPAGAHSVDERIPVSALEGGTALLESFLTTV